MWGLDEEPSGGIDEWTIDNLWQRSEAKNAVERRRKYTSNQASKTLPAFAVVSSRHLRKKNGVKAAAVEKFVAHQKSVISFDG